jgi:hypothetical protein
MGIVVGRTAISSGVLPPDFGGGPLPLPASNGTAYCVVKLDGNGNHVWHRSIGYVGPVNVTADASGNVILNGGMGAAIDLGGGLLTFGGGSDLFVAKLDAAGGHIWSKSFGDIGVPRRGSASRPTPRATFSCQRSWTAP